MSEQHRARLYDWWREHADDSLAEYVMSCLAPGPMTDLVTKEYLSAEFAKHTLALAAQREADRAQQAAQREADRAEQAAQREADRAEQAAQRETDRAEQAAQREADRAEQAAQRKSDRQKVGALGAFIVFEILAAEAGWLGSLVDLLSAAA